jgi:DNA-binding transcriptional LysR family regulator
MARGLPLPANIIETNSLPLITSLLRTTDMVVALPIESVQDYCDAGALSVLCRGSGIEIGSFGIITRRGYALSPGAQLVLQALRETAMHMYRREAGGGGPDEHSA